MSEQGVPDASGKGAEAPLDIIDVTDAIPLTDKKGKLLFEMTGSSKRH
jgi:hypothetical protein